MAGSILGFSLPTFWVGLLLIMVFAVQLGWLPSTGRGRPQDIFGIADIHTAPRRAEIRFPARPSTWRCSSSRCIIRLTRAQVREQALLDYIRFARAKGLPRARVIGVHLLKNILIPLVTVIGLELGSVIAFAIVTESIFAWPGMGKLVIDSIFQLDRPVVVAYLLVVGVHVHHDQPGGRTCCTRRSTRACASRRAKMKATERRHFAVLSSEFLASRLALFGLGC